MILLALTIVGVLFWPTVDSSYVGMAEASAVRRLLQLQAALETPKVDHKEQGYPQSLPNLISSYPVEKVYRFAYVPSRSPDGTITSYLIQATPLCRPCGCTREALPLPVAARFTSQLKDVPPQAPTIFCNDLQPNVMNSGHLK
jgi:hypothetical protein